MDLNSIQFQLKVRNATRSEIPVSVHDDIFLTLIPDYTIYPFLTSPCTVKYINQHTLKLEHKPPTEKITSQKILRNVLFLSSGTRFILN